MNVPLLKTERLILREPRLEDYPAYRAMWSDPRSRVHFAGAPFDEEDNWMRFQRGVGQWHLCGFGIWALETRADGRHAGILGFFLARRALNLPYRDAPETTWGIAPDLHGQGLAKEALAAAVAWADSSLDAPQTWCMIDPGNIPSERLATAFGYCPADSVTYKGRSLQTYLRSR